MMQVPQPVKVVFDKFPLEVLPAYTSKHITKTDQEGPILAVYNIDQDGLPLDPRCLMTFGALLLLNQRCRLEVTSPYISSAETLPVLKVGNKVATSLDESLKLFERGEELVSSPKVKLFRSLVDTWLDDAWHSTIMSSQNALARDAIYAIDPSFPWPFNRIAAHQLDNHLDIRHWRSKHSSGDDYVCMLDNLHRVGMALSSLESVISSPLKDEPDILDILVFAYVWPIVTVLPESALATMITPMLRQHAHEVRSFLINSGDSNTPATKA